MLLTFIVWHSCFILLTSQTVTAILLTEAHYITIVFRALDDIIIRQLLEKNVIPYANLPRTSLVSVHCTCKQIIRLYRRCRGM